MARDVVGPAGTEGRSHGAKETGRTRIRNECRHATSVKSAIVCAKTDGGFTVENRAVRRHGTVVGLETVFEFEEHLHAVAEIFRAADAEAACRVVARIHAEFVFVYANILRVVIVIVSGVGIGIGEAGVDDAVHFNIGRLNETDRSTGKRDGHESLLEHCFLLDAGGKRKASARLEKSKGRSLWGGVKTLIVQQKRDEFALSIPLKQNA